MATPPTHIYHSMLLHEALTAVHSSYGYGLLLRVIYIMREETSLGHVTQCALLSLVTTIVEIMPIFVQ